MKKAKTIFLSMIMMTATTLVMRTIGVSFSAYLFNRIGPVSVGVFQLISSVYSFAATLATSGIRFTTTRLVSEEMGQNRHLGVRRVVRKCLTYALLFSASTGVLLFFSAELIGTEWLNEPQTILPLKILAFALPFLSLTSVFGGYYTAMRKTVRSSIIQIADQMVMIAVSVMGLTLLLPKGLEYACVALVLGSCISEVVAFGSMFFSYQLDKRRLDNRKAETGSIVPRLLKISLPIAFSAYARSGLFTLQNILIPRGLKKFGASKEAAFTAYGNVHGMVLPLILYPSALLVALAELLIPELTECQVRNRQNQIHYIVTRVLKMSLIFSVCIMGILFFFSEDLSSIFGKDADIAFYIRILAPLVIVMYMDTIVDGMLKGLGEQLNSMKYNVIDAMVSVLLVYFLIPIFGIKGYIITVMVSEVLNFTLSLNRLIKVTQLSVNFRDVILKPFLCIFGTIAACYTFLSPDSFFCRFLPQNFVLQILMMCACYFVLLFLSSCLRKDDFKWFVSLVR